MEKVIIIGAGGHGRVVIDTVFSNPNLEVIGFLDDSDIESFLGISKLGKILDIEKFKEFKFHIAIGNNSLRKELGEKVGVKNLVTIIHPTAYICRDVKIGKGCFIGTNVVINSKSKLGNNIIVNTGSIIEHDCILENYSHLSYGVLLGSGVTIKEKAYIEMGEIVKRGLIVERDIR
ncbi:acetyltransferase [Cetobacterium sp.]|uniref:PglD-related sugar-binding protein n=1 Tax=Cetobacterium sp. TaxID=2071632 RepID=UPI003EE45BF9